MSDKLQLMQYFLLKFFWDWKKVCIFVRCTQVG